MATKRIRVTLRKSLIGRKPKHVKTIKALGLGRINSSADHAADPVILGMVNAVSHLIDVEEID